MYYTLMQQALHNNTVDKYLHRCASLRLNGRTNRCKMRICSEYN
jgi:hypothetical protein